MTQTSEPLTASVSAPPPRWAALRLSALAAGAVAAGLGLGGIAAAVLMLWIGSPFPDTSLGGALHVGADLWLLAQGADLVRTDTLSGDPAPVAVAPLLLSALPAWLVFRGTASAVAAAVDGKDADGPETDAGRGGPGVLAGSAGSAGSAGDHLDGRLTGPARLRAAAAVTGWVLAGYLTLAAIAAVYAAGGSVHVDPLTALYVLLFAGAAAGCGAWAGCGRPGPERLPLDRFRGGRLYELHRAYAEEVGAAVRAAAIAAGLLLAGGALIGAAALLWHMGAVGQTYQQLSGPLVGRLSVLLLAVGLVPNLAVWAASYALGTGFAVGAGSAVAPAGASGYLLLPGFPLLAALPHSGTSWVGWTTLAVPALAALAVAWSVGNDAWPVWSTVRVTAGAALFLGAGFAVLAAWSGGPLGLRRLADFGPSWWLAGAAAAGWTLAIAMPCALVLRYHVAHPPHPWRALIGELRVPRPRMPDVSWARLRRSAGSGTGEQVPSEAAATASPSAPGAPVSVRNAVPNPAPNIAPRSVPKPASAAPAAFPPPLPGLAPAQSDPLPWPNPAPLPLFPPPLPDLPPSAPPAPPAPPSAPPTPVPPRPAEPPAEPSTKSRAEPPVKPPAKPTVGPTTQPLAEPSADSPAEPSAPPAAPSEPQPEMPSEMPSEPQPDAGAEPPSAPAEPEGS